MDPLDHRPELKSLAFTMATRTGEQSFSADAPLLRAMRRPARDLELEATVFAVALLAMLLLAAWIGLPRDPFGGVAAYLPFHMFAETFSIVVALMTFAAMWNAYGPERAAGVVVLSCTMLATGLLDFGHMLSVSRMPDFVTPSSPDKGIAFWLAARFAAAAGMLAAALYAEQPLPRPYVRHLLLACTLGGTGLVYWIALFHLGWLPRFFVPGSGLTPIKVGAEYAVIALLVWPALVFCRRAWRTRSPTDIALAAATTVSILSEFFFALYAAAHDLFQVLGHAYKIVAFSYVYRAVFVASVREPAERLRRSERALQKSESELRNLNATLEERVHQRTAELEAANQELASFSYSVSHDLRAPLRAIDGYSRMLLKKYDERLDAEGKRLLNVVRDNTVRMAQLIDDILEFSRAGRLELSQSEVDMEALVRDVWQELSPASAGREIRLDLEPLPPARGDPAMLRQVWMNLLGNAVKFTRPRAVARIEVAGGMEAGECVYHVRDNGVGFDPKYTDKLFGVFERLHGIDEFEGTGIGLAIVKRIVTRHGGRVWAEGQVDGGATLHFTLPARL